MPEHARRRRKKALITTAGAAIVAALLLAPGADGAASPNAMPKGDLPGWRQVYADNFNGPAVPKGAFTDCGHNTDTPAAYCGGLKAYPQAYANYWAYPAGWDDTAKSGADGNTGAPFGGRYDPASTVWIGPASTASSDGVLHVRQYRPASGGDNRVAAVVPRRCMNMKYGKYSERFKVVKADPGFKSAHLFYDGGEEIDFPEGDWTKNISGYVHPGGAYVNTTARWTAWHTTSIEWTPGTVKYLLDGTVIKTVRQNITKPRAWIWQNESSIEGPYARPGASAEIQTTWATCYVRK